MNIEISTTEYQFAHGRMPRGYGQWAFRFGPKAEPVFYPCSNYGEALKRAKAEAKEIGATRIVICS